MRMRIARVTCLTVLALALALVAAPAAAQLPAVLENLENPHAVFGASYLTDNPGPDQKRFNFFMTVNLPLLKIPNVPCSMLGVGLTGGDLGPPYDEIEWGASLPIVTCSFGSASQLAIQGGWTVAFVGDPRPTGYYAGFGYSITSSAKLAEKRAKKKAEKEAREAQRLAALAPTKE